MGKILEFTIKNQRLFWENPCKIFEGSNNFFKIKVKPESEWVGLDLIAVFSSDHDKEAEVASKMDAHNECFIPDMDGDISFYIYGHNEKTSIKTQSFTIKQIGE